jgi:hypothetical protein
MHAGVWRSTQRSSCRVAPPRKGTARPTRVPLVLDTRCRELAALAGVTWGCMIGTAAVFSTRTADAQRARLRGPRRLVGSDGATPRRS